MNESISNRIGGTSAGEVVSNSGEVRRNRISEFQQNVRRAPHFYAQPRSESLRGSTPPEFEVRETPPHGFQAKPMKAGAIRLGWWEAVCLLAAGGIASAFLAAPAGFFIGHDRGKNSANREMVERAKTMKRLPDKEALVLSEAMTGLRAGRADAAMESLRSLRAKYPQTSSLSYLAALAALHAGQFVAAENLVTDSIKSGQRLSDSLALMAMLERQKSATAGGGSEARAEELLRAAITADAANPAPHIELATMLRRANRREEARREIKTAQALLNPVDAHAVTEVTLALMDLEDTADDQISPPSQQPRNLTEHLVAAYAAMRRDEFATAANFLRAAQAMTSPDIFAYLIGDPAFRKFRNHPEVASLWH